MSSPILLGPPHHVAGTVDCTINAANADGTVSSGHLAVTIGQYADFLSIDYTGRLNLTIEPRQKVFGFWEREMDIVAHRRTIQRIRAEQYLEGTAKIPLIQGVPYPLTQPDGYTADPSPTTLKTYPSPWEGWNDTYPTKNF